MTGRNKKGEACGQCARLGRPCGQCRGGVVPAGTAAGLEAAAAADIQPQPEARQQDVPNVDGWTETRVKVALEAGLSVGTLEQTTADGHDPYAVIVAAEAGATDDELVDVSGRDGVDMADYSRARGNGWEHDQFISVLVLEKRNPRDGERWVSQPGRALTEVGHADLQDAYRGGVNSGDRYLDLRGRMSHRDAVQWANQPTANVGAYLSFARHSNKPSDLADWGELAKRLSPDDCRAVQDVGLRDVHPEHWLNAHYHGRDLTDYGTIRNLNKPSHTGTMRVLDRFTTDDPAGWTLDRYMEARNASVTHNETLAAQAHQIPADRYIEARKQGGDHGEAVGAVIR